MAIRYQQPQGAAQINWNNQLAPKTGLWVPDRNIVTGKQPTYAGTGNAPSKIVTRSGVELFTDGKLVQTDLPAQAFSVLTWCMLFTPAAAPSGATFVAALQTQQATLNWHHSNASYQGAFTLYAGGGYPTCKFVNGFTAGKQVLLHGTYDGTSIRVYRNGVLENTTAASNSVSGVTVESLQFLGGNGGTAPFVGSVAYVSWDTTRALTSAQVRAHADNIYQVFQPQARSLWVAAAVGTTHTLIGASSAQSAGSTTGAVTQTHALTGAASTQGATSSAASVTQAQQLAGAASTQSAASGTGVVSVGGVHNLTAATTTQAAGSGSGVVGQSHKLVSAPSVQDNIASASAIVQAHLLPGAACQQGASSAAGAVILGALATPGAMAGQRIKQTGQRSNRIQSGARPAR